MRTITLSKGALYILLGAFCFSLSSLCVKMAGKRLPFLEIVLGRSIVSVALCMLFIRKAGVKSLGNNKKFLLLRGCFGFIALSCMFFSLVHIPLASAVVLFYTHPIFAAILSFLFLRERIGIIGILCIIISLCGVVFVAKPPFLFKSTVSIRTFYTLVPVMAAFFAASAYVTIRKLGTSENPYVIVLYLYLITLPLSFLLVLPYWVWPTPLELALIIAIGVFAQIAQVNLTKGLSLETAGKATAIGNIQIVFVAIWGFLFFDELPDIWLIIGALLIITSTVILSQAKE